MTPSDRMARGERAKAAMAEFFGPAFEHVEQEYAERMIATAASTDPRAPEVIARLANGVKAARVVRGQIEAFIMDGKMAEEEAKRGAKIAQMSDFHRATIGA